MTRHATGITSLLLAVASAAAVAQTPRAGNPHGDMDLDCRLCHTEANWDVRADSLAFDHGTTGFPLEGRHAGVPCRDCHEEPVFAHVGVRCLDCHLDAHRGRLGPDCEACHQPAGWVDRNEERRSHDATAFPLVGAHARVDCDACHEGAVAGEFVGTPTDCYACHRDTYEGTTDPDHAAAGFPTDCRQCHDEFASTWGRGDFIHSPRFPLTGAHARAACISCHEDGFAGTPTDCYACHQQDYDATTDPGHVAAGFPTACAACHTTNAWEPADFDHGATAFPLTGAHRAADCLSCHATGYTGTPTDCYACHQQDYDGTDDPDHAAAGFPTTCRDCHTTNAWEPADFDHDQWFPIATGKHGGLDCNQCHVTPNSYGTFECILCHEHNQTDTASHHDPGEVPDYVWESSACYDCHPRGRGD
jgi:hypothetical protein